MSHSPDLQLGDCSTCAAGTAPINVARYVTADGRACCAIHAGPLAVRLLDVPRVLELVHVVMDELDGSPICVEEFSELRGYLGRR